jgi:hypothetical protein
MTDVGVLARIRPSRLSFAAAIFRRLLRLELRRSAMIWMLPLLAAAFWLDTYHFGSGDPPIWTLRASNLPNHLLRDFSAFAAGVAAWMASRESRRRVTGQLTATAWSAWARRLATWAATTCWLLAAYLSCVAVLYGVTAAQATWGGPPAWPAALCAVALVAVCAVGFAIGAFLPSRFTAPLVAVATLLLSSAIRTASPYALLWPTTGASPDNTGGLPLTPPDAGVFYHYLPDLSIAQVMFMTGVAVVALGVLGLFGTAGGGRRLHGIAAVVTVAGLAAVGTAAGLTGTARQGAFGVIIPALHDAASDQPIPYTPVCAQASGIPVCVHPAYRDYLGDVAGALAPVLREVAGLPGAPVRISQVPSNATMAPSSVSGSVGPGPRPVYTFPMGLFPPGSAGLLQLDRGMQATIVSLLVNDARLFPPGAEPASGLPAQEVVEWVLLRPFNPQAEQYVATAPDAQVASPAVSAAAARFGALPATVRHAWLAAHLAALRAGRITLSQLP